MNCTHPLPWPLSFSGLHLPDRLRHYSLFPYVSHAWLCFLRRFIHSNCLIVRRAHHPLIILRRTYWWSFAIPLVRIHLGNWYITLSCGHAPKIFRERDGHLGKRCTSSAAILLYFIWERFALSVSCLDPSVLFPSVLIKISNSPVPGRLSVRGTHAAVIASRKLTMIFRCKIFSTFNSKCPDVDDSAWNPSSKAFDNLQFW